MSTLGKLFVSAVKIGLTAATPIGPIVLISEIGKHAANAFAGDEGYDAVDKVDKAVSGYDHIKKEEKE